jgi:AhpD family alkylhydroperoxidase
MVGTTYGGPRTMSRSPPASAIGRSSPNIVEGYQTLGRAGAVTGLLGVKMNELIALAVALAVRCDDCIAVHTAAAIRAGTTHEEIAEIFSDAAAHAMARMIENVPAPGGNAAKPHSMMAMSPGMTAASDMSNGAGTGIPEWPMPGSSTTGVLDDGHGRHALS